MIDAEQQARSIRQPAYAGQRRRAAVALASILERFRLPDFAFSDEPFAAEGRSACRGNDKGSSALFRPPARRRSIEIPPARLVQVALNRCARKIAGISKAKTATAACTSRTAKTTAASNTTKVMMA